MSVPLKPRPLRLSPLPTTVIMLGLTSMFADLGAEMIFPLLPVFLAGLGAGGAFLGIMEGSATAISSLLRLGSGWLADRLDQKKSIIFIGYAMAALLRPLIGLATLPWHVMAVRLSDRFGKGIRSPARDTLLASAAAEGEVGRAFGFHNALDHVGAVIGPLLAAGLLAAGFEMRQVFLFTIIPGLLTLLCVGLLREPEEPEPEPAAAAAAGAPKEAAILRAPLPRALKLYMVILLIFSLGQTSNILLVLRAQELGMSEALLPIAWMVFNLAQVVSAYSGGAWSDRVPRTRVILVGWGSLAVVYVGLAVASEAWMIWPLFVLYGACQAIIEPAEKALVKDLVPPGQRGRAYGAFHFCTGISAVPAGFLTGWLWDHVGAGAALGVGAAASVIGAALVVLWQRSEGVGSATIP